jgi:hypothetical protein
VANTTAPMNTLEKNVQNLLVHLEEHDHENSSRELRSSNIINLFEYQHYYLFVFAVLEKLLYLFVIDHHRQNFMQHFQHVENSLPLIFTGAEEVNRTPDLLITKLYYVFLFHHFSILTLKVFLYVFPTAKFFLSSNYHQREKIAILSQILI